MFPVFFFFFFFLSLSLFRGGRDLNNNEYTSKNGEKMKLNNKKKRRENMRYEMCNKRIRVKVNSTTVLTKMDSRRGSNKRSAVLPGSTPENCNRMCRYSDESMIGCEV